jgi:hypothetical protein
MDLPAQYAWFNQFEVVSGTELVGAFEVAWGSCSWGDAAKVVIWSDPDGNGDPSDAELLLEVSTTIQSPNSSNGPADFVTVTIPPTYVGPAGTSFFAGAFYADSAGTDYPVAVDQDAPAGQSFWASSSGAGAVLDIGDLAGTAGWMAPLAETGYDGNLLIRLRGIVDNNTADCNVNGVLDACEIVEGDEPDSNCDLIIDYCQCAGDLDGDADVSGSDLAAVLTAWGTSDILSDFDCSGHVDVIDLLFLLAAWGDCP